MTLFSSCHDVLILQNMQNLHPHFPTLMPQSQIQRAHRCTIHRKICHRVYEDSFKSKDVPKDMLTNPERQFFCENLPGAGGVLGDISMV